VENFVFPGQGLNGGHRGGLDTRRKIVMICELFPKAIKRATEHNFAKDGEGGKTTFLVGGDGDHKKGE